MDERIRDGLAARPVRHPSIDPHAVFDIPLSAMDHPTSIDVNAADGDAPAPPAPACFIAVGVTGHRLGRLEESAIADISRRADLVLRAIMAAGGDVAPASFRLVTGLADGADSIVADRALALGWTLNVVLAFERDDFACDFAEGEARVAHEKRLAGAEAVFALPGRRDEAGSGAAYERVGRTVLAQSDLLIAVWDNEPARGPGGAAQIAAEAVLQNMPVILVEPTIAAPPVLLWDGLIEHDLGAQTVATVARGDLDQLPALVASLVGPPGDPREIARFDSFAGESPWRRSMAFAYPLLLMVMGVRKRRHATPQTPVAEALLPPAFAASAREMLAARYTRADASASHFAHLFRSGYVTNFGLAALAVVLSLAGLALPSVLKPALLIAEVTVIGAILLTTRAGNRAGWHRSWLDSRQLAERLRCLAISAQLGELGLRAGSGNQLTWVEWHARATARTVGLPSVKVDGTYLARVRRDLIALIEGQVAYLAGESGRMHRLEHRLHSLGTMLFAATAIVCVSFLGYEGLAHLVHDEALEALTKPLAIAATILSAALPAIGAAIYGIRMQGDFAGTAERSESLSHHLSMLRTAIDGDDESFDTLKRRVARATDLLTEDLANWLATYHARPLTLPG
jgi:hypothetical protein